LVNLGNPANPPLVKGFETLAKTVGAEIVPFDVREAEQLERGFAAMGASHADALIVANDPLFYGYDLRRQIIALAAKHRLVTMYPSREFTESSGLMSYGQNLAEFYRRAADYVDKILKGARPADLPIEQPIKFELVINRKTADALGLSIPRTLLLRADEVIE
jgi:putative ABC transport system substrate-binding protein